MIDFDDYSTPIVRVILHNPKSLAQTIEGADLLPDYLNGECEVAGYESELAQAAEAGDIEAAKKALADGASPDIFDCGFTPLMIAAQNDDIDMLRFLAPISDAALKSGEQGRTALSLATEAAGEECIAFLASLGSIQELDHEGMNALHCAVSYLNDETWAAEILLDAGADPNAATGLDAGGVTPLMIAAMQNRWQCIDLLAPLSSLEARDSLGSTALHHAARGGFEGTVERLVKAGADLASRDRDGHDIFEINRQEMEKANGSPHLMQRACYAYINRLEERLLVSQAAKGGEPSPTPRI